MARSTIKVVQELVAAAEHQEITNSYHRNPAAERKSWAYHAEHLPITEDRAVEMNKDVAWLVW